MLDEAQKAQKPGRMYKNSIEHEEVTMYTNSETKCTKIVKQTDLLLDYPGSVIITLFYSRIAGVARGGNDQVVSDVVSPINLDF